MGCVRKLSGNGANVRLLILSLSCPSLSCLCSSAVDHKTNQSVAVKKIENVFDHRSLAKRTLRELKLVRTFQHENILGLDRVMRPHSAAFNNIYLVSELMETDLACVIRSPQELTDEHCQFFIYQVLRGLKYIHSANGKTPALVIALQSLRFYWIIYSLLSVVCLFLCAFAVIHRDLKPRNLLVNSNCDLKICDFGLARVDDPENKDRAAMSNYIATRWYRAPEVILGKKRYTKAVDLWSVGCILAELIGRKPIFPGRDSFHQITLICSALGTPTTNQVNGSSKNSAPVAAAPVPLKGAAGTGGAHGPTDDYISALPKKPKVPFQQLYPKASASACDLLDKLLVFDPDKRLTVEEALKHPYLGELHCEDDEPTCKHMDFTDFYFEYLKLTKEDLRVLIHQGKENKKKKEKERLQLPVLAHQLFPWSHLGRASVCLLLFQKS
jgi:mitogen-activated protein kinase 1/3